MGVGHGLCVEGGCFGGYGGGSAGWCWVVVGGMLSGGWSVLGIGWCVLCWKGGVVFLRVACTVARASGGTPYHIEMARLE